MIMLAFGESTSEATFPVKGQWGVKSIPACSEHEAGYALDRVPVYHHKVKHIDRETHSHTQTGFTVNPNCISLGHRDHANSTQRAASWCGQLQL